MTSDSGIIDEVFGVFTGAGLAVGYFNTDISVPFRLYFLFNVAVFVANLALAARKSQRKRRTQWYLVTIMSVLLPTIVVYHYSVEPRPDLLSLFSMAIGGTVWIILRELVPGEST